MKADMNVGFYLMINDMRKAGAREMYDIDENGNTPAKFGYVTLSGDKVSLPKKADPAAAKTADMGVIVSAISLAMTSGALVVLKKRK